MIRIARNSCRRKKAGYLLALIYIPKTLKNMCFLVKSQIRVQLTASKTAEKVKNVYSMCMCTHCKFNANI